MVWWCTHKTWGHHPCPGHLLEGSCRLSPLNSTHSSCCSCWLFSCNYFIIDTLCSNNLNICQIFSHFSPCQCYWDHYCKHQKHQNYAICIINLNLDTDIICLRLFRSQSKSYLTRHFRFISKITRTLIYYEVCTLNISIISL